MCNLYSLTINQAAILTTPEEIETWMTGTVKEALPLQRPLPDGSLRIVARGTKEDGGAG
jgi:putative SOS response-associated peptidase YedK